MFVSVPRSIAFVKTEGILSEPRDVVAQSAVRHLIAVQPREDTKFSFCGEGSGEVSMWGITPRAWC